MHGTFVHQRFKSAFKRTEFVSDNMSYIVLRHFCQEISMQYQGENIFSKQFGMKVYMVTVLTVGLEQQTLPHAKILSKTLPFHIKTFINIFGPLLMGRFLSQ